MVYLIKYELNQPGKNYASLYATLQQYQYVRDNALHSTWFVSTSWTALQVYSHIAPHIDRNDRIFITLLRRGEYYGWMDLNIWTWINARV